MMVLLAGQVFLPVVPQDEGQLLAYPWFMAHGLMLYRDIWNMYPPATYIILAVLMKAGVPGLVAERGLSVSVHALYPLLINRASTSSWRRFSWLAVLPAFTFLFLVAYPDIRAYPWNLGIAVFIGGLIVARSRPRLAALVFLLCGTVRLELVAPALVMFAVAGVLDAGRRRQFIESAVILAAGTGLILGILTVLTSGAAFDQLVVDAFIRIPPGRSLPFHPLALNRVLLPLEVVTLLGPAALACTGLVKRRGYIVASNMAIAMLAAHYLQRAESDYLYAVSAAVVPWLVLSLVSLRGSGDTLAPHTTPRGTRALLTTWLAIIALSASALTVLMLVLYPATLSPLMPGTPSNVSTFGARQITNGTNSIVASSPHVARDDRQVLTYLKAHASLRQRIYISPIGLRHAMWNMTSMYFLLEMTPGTRYLEMNPGVETRASVQREIIHALHRTTWVLLWKGGFWYEANASQKLGSPLLARYIPRHYRTVLTNFTYELLRKTRA